jgi:hypothetical protein
MNTTQPGFTRITKGVATLRQTIELASTEQASSMTAIAEYEQLSHRLP